MPVADGHKCWAENKVWQVGHGWRNADAAACQHWRPGCSAPTDTVVHGLSLSLLARREPGREWQANAVGGAVSDPGHDQTSECWWQHVQQRSTPTVICLLLSLVHQPGWCYSNHFASSQQFTIQRCGQRVRVHELPDMPELTSVETACTDTREDWQW